MHLEEHKVSGSSKNASTPVMLPTHLPKGRSHRKSSLTACTCAEPVSHTGQRTKVKEMLLASKIYKYFQTDVIKYITQVLQPYLNSFLLLFKYYMLGAQFIFLNKTAYLAISCSQSSPWLYSGTQWWKIKFMQDLSFKNDKPHFEVSKNLLFTLLKFCFSGFINI